MASDRDDEDRAPAGRWLLPVILLFSAAVVLGALHDDFRPRFLDGPSNLARNALRYLGIYPGLAVFNSAEQSPGRNRLVTARCVEVLAFDASGQPERVFPERWDCPPTGVRLQHPPEEILVTRLLMWATEDESRRQLEGSLAPDPGIASLSQVLLPSVGHYFNQRERLRGTPRDRLLIRYTQHKLNTDTFQRYSVPVVLFEIRAGEPSAQATWFPTPQQAAAAWPVTDER